MMASISSTLIFNVLAMVLLASVIFSSTNFLMMASISSTLIFNVLAMVLNSVQTFAERTSSHLTTNSSSLTSSMVGKKCFLISSMISLALVIPLAMMSFITFMTSANFTWNFAAISRILLHTSAERASSHLKLVAMSMIFWRTNLMISLALVIPLATASRTILSTISTLTFNFLAASFKVAQIFSERISSQVMVSSIMSSPDGKKCFLISSMISLALVIPLATISFITFMTVSYLIFIAAATSLILAHQLSGRTSSHLKLVASSTIFSRTNLMISSALVIPFSMASRMILSTISAFTF